MKNLTLSIQRGFFEEILDGTKKKEFREVKPTNVKQYLKVDENNEPIFATDKDLTLLPVEYDTLTLYTGQYKGKRPGIVVEVKKAKAEAHPSMVYTYKGEKYVKTFIEYHLGEIIEKLNFENLTPYNPPKFEEIGKMPIEMQKKLANIEISKKKVIDERSAKLNNLIKGKLNTDERKHPILKK